MFYGQFRGIVSFLAHYLLRIFPHKKSVTVSKLSDYITRRKKSQYLNEVKNKIVLLIVLGLRIAIIDTGALIGFIFISIKKGRFFLYIHRYLPPPPILAR